jgi:hypothetical protein
MRGILLLSRFAHWPLSDIDNLSVPEFIDFLNIAVDLAASANR